jgi:hypothetical protein
VRIAGHLTRAKTQAIRHRPVIVLARAEVNAYRSTVCRGRTAYGRDRRGRLDGVAMSMSSAARDVRLISDATSLATS